MRELFHRTPPQSVLWNLEWNVTLAYLTDDDSDGYQSPVVDGVDIDVDELDAEREALADGDTIHLSVIWLEKRTKD